MRDKRKLVAGRLRDLSRHADGDVLAFVEAAAHRLLGNVATIREVAVIEPRALSRIL